MTETLQVKLAPDLMQYQDLIMSHAPYGTTPSWFTETRPVKKRHHIAFIAALVVCFVTGFFGIQAVADTPDADVQMRYQQFDLDTRQGVQATYQRLLHIAYANCDLDIAQIPSAAGKACVATLMTSLLDKVADPFLSYVHQYPEELALAQR